ncbi:hypothetical protein [Paenibacillus sp. J2TS4]|uniref:hypothetical protein n=1 Tax=Paenibacillus sp. J2TS4 TaxID=2807194 RepID=UPI001BD0CD7A|nr:hypothetical protein [Paenibacillus sp. J2TS4]
MNPELQPPPNTLWCICCEGVSWSDFENHMNEWSDYAYVGKGALKNVYPRNFVGLMLYVFQSVDGDKLCIVPQCKVQPMREQLNVCEQDGLSRGSHIVLFHSQSGNRLVSIICADAYHEDIKSAGIFFPSNQDYKNIVLHPQLNSDPRNKDIAALRNRMFEEERGRHTLYITANWAHGTSIGIAHQPDTTIRIKAPWSSIYKRNVNYSRKEMDEILHDVRVKNFKFGLGFAFAERTKLKVWYAVKYEHLQMISLRKPYAGGPELTRPAGTVQASESYIPNESNDGWKEEEIKFDSTLPEVLAREATGDFDYPRRASVDDLDRFLSYCLGYIDGNELLLDDEEMSNRLSYHIDDDCEIHRGHQISNVVRLIHCLKQLAHHKYPSPIRRIQGGFKFDLVDKNSHYNIISKQPRVRAGALVAFVERENDAKQRAYQLIEKCGEYNYSDKICVFSYKPYTTEIIHYPQHNDDVTAIERVEKKPDYSQGGHSIEPTFD